MAEVQHTRTVVCHMCGDFTCRLHTEADELPAEICARAHDLYCPKAVMTHAGAIKNLINAIENAGAL